MLAIELSQKTVNELLKLEEESRAELFALRFQASIGNLEKPHRIKELKVTIARILTIFSEKEKLTGEKINRNIKVDLSKTFKSIEKDTKLLLKKRKDMAEKMMAEQDQKSNANDMFNNSLFDQSLFEKGSEIVGSNNTNPLLLKENNKLPKLDPKILVKNPSDLNLIKEDKIDVLEVNKETLKNDIELEKNIIKKSVIKEEIEIIKEPLVLSSIKTKNVIKEDIKTDIINDISSKKNIIKKSIVKEGLKSAIKTDKKPSIAKIKIATKKTIKKDIAIDVLSKKNIIKKPVMEEVKEEIVIKTDKKTPVIKTIQKTSKNKLEQEKNLNLYSELSFLLTIPVLEKLNKLKQKTEYKDLDITKLKSCYSKILVPDNKVLNFNNNNIAQKLFDNFNEIEVKKFIDIIKNTVN